jgi:hypothetical protein
VKEGSFINAVFAHPNPNPYSAAAKTSFQPLWRCDYFVVMRAAYSSGEALPAERPSERGRYRSAMFACTPLAQGFGDGGRSVKLRHRLGTDTNAPRTP